jgi:hypothetical protein
MRRLGTIGRGIASGTGRPVPHNVTSFNVAALR